MSPNKGGAKSNRAASMGGGGVAASEASVSSTDESNAASAAAKVHAAPMCPHVGKAVNIKGVKKTLGVAWYDVMFLRMTLNESQIKNPLLNPKKICSINLA